MHTEESLMELAKECTHKLANEANWHGLRLAIRKVLAERDHAEAVATAEAYEQDKQQKRAERAEAECERLRQGGCARDQRLTQYCAEAERLRKDAERFSWWAKDPYSNFSKAWRLWSGQDDWRNAIDAAMQEKQP